MKEKGGLALWLVGRFKLKYHVFVALRYLSFVRGLAHRQVLSNHAFGTAFDINYAWNKLGAEPAVESMKGSVYPLIPLAHKHGFYWGGHFSRKDGMHFEIAKVIP
jgi:hypothetical protein